jgi:hypothetical protein
MVDYTNCSADEIADSGERLYQRRILPNLKPEHQGQFLVLDLASEDYEIDPKHVEATKRMLARHPDGVLYSLRIGHPTLYHLRRAVI